MKVNNKMLLEMNKLYDEGATTRELAIVFNVSRCTIANYLWKPRPVGGKRKKEIPQEVVAERITIPLIEEINELYNRPLRMKDVAKELKIRVNTVCKYVRVARKQGRKVT